MMKKPRPPRLGRFFLRWQPLGDRREEVDADLLELFDLRVATRGRRYAAWRYCLDALSVWRLVRMADVSGSVRAVRPRRSWFDGVGQDVVFASRLFRREPALFSLTIGGMALAIAITTSVFSVVYPFAFPPPGVPEPRSTYRLSVARGSSSGAPWAYADYLRLQAAPKSFEPAAAVAPGLGVLEFGGDSTREVDTPRYIHAGIVSGNFFRVMGGRVSIGRPLLEDDDKAGAAQVMVLSDRLWQSEFAADPQVVGQRIHFGRELFTIVGVAARGFTGSDELGAAPACWISLTSYSESREREPKSEFDRRWLTVQVFTRLTRGNGQSAVEDEATAVAVALAAERGMVDATTRPRVELISFDEPRSDSSAGTFVFTVVIVIVGLIVVLTAANVANLLLASAAGRSREMAVRLTLGANRTRILRQLVTESLTLSLLGGAAGFVLTFWTAPLLARALQAPDALDVSPGFRVFAFALLVTTAVGLFAGLAPARHGRRGALLPALKDDSPLTTSVRSSRLRSTLVGMQAGASIVLLVCATLLTRSLVEVIRFDYGIDAAHLVQVNFDFRRSQTTPVIEAYLHTAQERLRQIPGVTGAALTLIAPFERGYAPQRIGKQSPRTVGAYLRGESFPVVLRHETSAEYFQTVGVRIVRGRSFTADEQRAGAPVAVISASAARQFWAGEDPIGSSLLRVWGDDDPADGRPRGLMRKPRGTRIIGVAAETITRLQSYDAPAIYLPLEPSNLHPVRLVVRTSGDPARYRAPIREALKAVDRDIEISTSLVSDGVQAQMQYPKVYAIIAGVFGSSTLVLAVIGLFGVTAFVVGQRRREMSVRLALGATGTDVVRLLVRDALRPVVIGMGCGLFLSLLAGHVIRGMLYGVSGHDPMSIVSAILILIAAATGAALGPARRALRINPSEMLKQS
jgi:predicted permease